MGIEDKNRSKIHGLAPAILLTSLSATAEAKPDTKVDWLGDSITICKINADTKKSCKKVLRGSKAATGIEDAAAAKAGKQFSTYKDLEAALKSGQMIAVPPSQEYVISNQIGQSAPEVRNSYLSLRPHTKAIFDKISHAFFSRFKVPLKVTSLSRTVAYVRRINKEGNANARANSSHTYGISIDIAYGRMMPEQRQWIELYLVKLEEAGEIQVTKERGQTCYHIADLKACEKPSPKATDTKLAERKPAKSQTAKLPEPHKKGNRGR